MTANAVIDEIKQLPRAEQARVLQFVCEMGRVRQLSGAELSALARQLADAETSAEAQRLREQIHRGFYGE